MAFENQFPATFRTRETADCLWHLVIKLLKKHGRPPWYYPMVFYLAKA